MIGIWKNRLKNKNVLKYLKSTGWLLANKFLGLFSGLFIGIWVAKFLGPEKYGEFNYVQSFVGLFAIIANLGLDSLIVRELVNGKNKNKILGTAFGLKIIGSLILFLILILCVVLNIYDGVNPSFIFIVAFATSINSFKIIEYYFTSKVLGNLIAKANIAALICTSFLKVYCILNDFELFYFFWILVIESFIVAIGYVYFYQIKIGALSNWKFDKNVALELLKDGWPLILSGFIIMVYMKIDQVMIKELMNSESVGYYAVAARLSELWYFIPAIVADSLFPAILNVQKNKNEYEKRLKNLYSIMFISSIAIAIPISTFGDFIITTLYGSDFIVASNPLKIHIWSGIFVFMGYVYNKYLIAENYTKIAFYRTLMGATVNIIANFILIPKLGISGAAIATLLSQAITNYFIDLFNKQLRPQFILKTKAFITFPRLS